MTDEPTRWSHAGDPVEDLLPALPRSTAARPAGGAELVPAPPVPDWLFREESLIDVPFRGRSTPPPPPPAGWSASPPAPPVRPAGSRAGSRRRRRGVVAIAAAAVLVGGVAGAGLVEATGHRAAAAPAINTGQVNVAGSGTSSPSVAQIVKSVAPAIVSITATDGDASEDEGTGMIISSSGEVVTNNHVIDGATTITVALNGSKTQLRATLVGTDPDKDVALLRIAGKTGLPTVSFGPSGQVQVGDSVVAIGNALALGDSESVTSGIVSALDRQVTAGGDAGGGSESLKGMIQTSAAINPGNSGGALLDSSGLVIGMNTAAAGTTPDGTSAENIGFAIPSTTIESLLPGLRAGGDGSQDTIGGTGSSSAGSESSGSDGSGSDGDGSGSYGGGSDGSYGSGADGSGGDGSGSYDDGSGSYGS